MSFSAGRGTSKAKVFFTHSSENGAQCVGGLQVTWYVDGSVCFLPSAIA